MKEGQPTTGERAGRGIRNTGIVIGLLGLIGMAAEVAYAPSVAAGGAVLAVSGEIFRRVSKPKK